MHCVGVSFRRQPSAPHRFFAEAANDSEADAEPSVGISGITSVCFVDVNCGEAPLKEKRCWEELEDILKRKGKED